MRVVGRKVLQGFSLTAALLAASRIPECSFSIDRPFNRLLMCRSRSFICPYHVLSMGHTERASRCQRELWVS